MGNLKFIYITILLSLSLTTIQAQDAATAAKTSFGFISSNDILIACTVFLGLVIIGLGNVLKSAISYHRHRKKTATSESIKTLLVLIALVWWGVAAAQGGDTEAPVTPTYTFTEADFFRGVMLIIILLEMITIFLFAKWIKYFTGIKDYEESLAAAKAPTEQKSKTAFQSFWERINKFQPIEHEAQIDTGHSYDGIRELNNVTPPWFKIAFTASIVFAVIYLWRYEVSGSGLSQIEEYEREVAIARAKQEEYLKKQANKVDETNVTMLDAAGIAAGAKLYATNCTACHGDKGQGGVGPNLTDKYWLHGGSLSDIFKSIKYGWPAQGMKSWKDDFSPVQIAQLTSYIKSIQNTNPPGAKEPQGEEYIDEVVENNNTSDNSSTGNDSNELVAQ